MGAEGGEVRGRGVNERGRRAQGADGVDEERQTRDVIEVRVREEDVVEAGGLGAGALAERTGPTEVASFFAGK